MYSFTITPDLRVLSKDPISLNSHEFDFQNPNSKPYEITLEFDWEIIENEQAFKKSFQEILRKYQLLKHHDNLLYLILTTFDVIWSEVEQIHENHQSKIKAKQIAQLLLLLKATKPGKLRELRIDSLTDTAIIKDPTVNDWIVETLTKSLELKQFPIGKFGNEVLKMLSINGNALATGPADINSLRHYAALRLTNPKNSINKRIAVLAVVILQYLENETEMKAKTARLVSDEQAILIYNILCLFKQIDDNGIDSVAKDYIRTMIKNHIK